MRRDGKVALVLVLVLLLGGCSQWELPPVLEGSGVLVETDWLHELRRVQQLPAAEQAAELEARRKAYRADTTNDHRLRLALLLALGKGEVRDESRALTLLEELDSDSQGPSEAALAGLLRQWLRERQRLLGQLQAERKALAERDSRIQELESQLDAVTSIEKSIRQRQKSLPGVEP